MSQNVDSSDPSILTSENQDQDATSNSNLHQLLKDHLILDSSERQTLQDSVLEERLSLSLLDRVIGQDAHLLEPLSLEHKVTPPGLDEWDAPLAPISRLPIELLSHIMQDTLPGDSRNINDVDLSLGKQLVTLVHVSSPWRTIAMSAPYLWQCICISRYTPSDFCIWLLQRSLKLPLFLRVICSDPTGDSDCMSFGPAMDILMSESERWQTLTFDWLPLNPEVKLSSVRGRLPLLHELTLGGTWDEQRRHTIDIVDVFITAPALRDLSISYPFSSSIIILPWEQLTEFTCARLSLADLLIVFSKSPNLETAHLWEIGNDGKDIAEYQRPNMQHLERLQMVWNTPNFDDISLFLSYLTLPSLSKLILSISQAGQNKNHSVTQLLNSLPPLLTLVLRLDAGGEHNTEDVVETWLDVFSSAYGDGTPVHAGSIQRLRISAQDYYPSVKYAALIASIAEARWHARPINRKDPFPKFTFAFSDASDDEPLAVLMNGQENGNFQLFSAVESDGRRRTAIQSLNPGKPIDIWLNPDDALNRWSMN